MDQVFDKAGHVARSWSFSLPILVLVFLFIFVDSVVSLILYTLLLVVIPFLYSFDIMRGHPYVVLE